MKRVIVTCLFLLLSISVNADIEIFNYYAPKGDILAMKRKFNNGVDVDVVDGSAKQTPLTYVLKSKSINNKRKLEVIEWLIIEEGADPRHIDGYFYSYVHIAAFWKCGVEIVDFLISQGSDFNYLTRSKKESPLFGAFSSRDLVVVDYLIDKGAIFSGKENNIGFKGTIEEAIRTNHIGWFYYHLLYEVHDIDKKDKEGRTLLCLVRPRIDFAKMLISRGANINAKDNSGDTTLHDAVLHGDIEYVKYLLNSGADTQLENSRGRTPLELAEFYALDPMVELIINFEKTKPKEIKPAELIPYRGHLAFEITIDNAAIGKSHRIEYSIDSKTWQTLETITLQNETTLYLDKSGVGQPKRFYRVKSGG